MLTITWALEPIMTSQEADFQNCVVQHTQSAKQKFSMDFTGGGSDWQRT